MKNKQVWVYDIETLCNVFTYTAINRDSDEKVSFVIWKNRNDLPQLLEHLDNCRGQIGFNNNNFDYVILHLLLINRDKYIKYNGDRVAKLLFKEAQRVINSESKWTAIKNPLIPQLDLYKVHHFDNFARSCSLKKLEISLGFENVQDMPIDFNTEVTNNEQIDLILDYNLNDVKATKLFYTKTIDKIELRKGLLKKYDLPCLNYSDSKIGEELMLKLYCDAVGRDPKVVKKERTSRYNFKFIECIPKYVKFKTNEFNELLDYLKKIEVRELNQSFNYEFIYNNFTFVLGTGGIHGCIKEGVYKSNEEMIIIDADVSSLYPSLAIVNNFYPQHLGSDFCKVYENEIVKPRLEAKKNGDKIMADGFKLSANSVYGKSNSEYSFLFDPLYTLKTTLAGQLSLCMLSEMLMTRVPNITLLQINTDGITVTIPKKYKRLYWEICKEWESITKLQLEYVAYKKMVIRDVNNYLSVSTEGKIKRKGAFRLHEEMLKEGEYYKSFSQGIVPIALSEYFLNNISVETTIKNHKRIYDFCKTFNATHGWKCETLNIDELGNEINLKEEQKTDRYYISKEGKKFRKRNNPLKPKYKTKEVLNKYDKEKIDSLNSDVQIIIKDLIEKQIVDNSQQVVLKIYCNGELMKILEKNQDVLNMIYNVSSVEIIRREGEIEVTGNKHWRIIDIEASDLVIIFNKFEDKPFEEYKVDYEYYINEANKIIDTITGEKERRENEEKQKRLNERLKKEEENFVQYCINKIPTERQFNEYQREWLIEKYGKPKEIKPSKIMKNNLNTLAFSKEV